MMKFSALNESSLSDDNGDPELASREAQEEEAYSMYHSALRKQFQGNLEEAEEIFKDLLEEEFLTQAQPKEEKNAGPLGPALTLKYLVYKNLATICKDRDDWNGSVSFYLEALEIDSTDVMMWYNMGKASLKIANYSLARLCFEEGLKCNPNHWPSLDNVISVMYVLNDYANCLHYISLALERECYYLKGLVIKDYIYKEDPSLKSLCDSYFKNCDSSIHFAEYDKEEAEKIIQECLDMRERKRSFYKPKPLPVLGLGIPIKEYTWKNLGDSLINVYDCIANADPCVSFSCKVDLSPYLENKMPSESNSDQTNAPSSLSSLSEPSSNNSVSPVSNAEQQNNGEIVIVPTLQEPTLEEMEVDETNNESKATDVQNVLLLPQADAQPNDLSVYTDSTSSSRRTKRKRSEFAEFSDFVSKRRSTRVRNPAVKRPQDNTNYQELLHKFLPAKLIGDGKFDEQDYDSDTFSQDKSNGDHAYGQSTEKDKKDSSDPSNPSNVCSTEKDEVCEFIAKNQSNGGVIDLLYRYVVILGAKSKMLWPKSVIDVYCSTFSRLRKHITVPNLFSHRTEVFRIKELAWAFLTYCEFKVDNWYQSTGNSMPFCLKTSPNSCNFPTDKVGNDFHSDMEFLVQLTSRCDVFEEEWLNFSARALWLKAKFHSLEGEIDLAACYMGKLYDIVSGDDTKHTKITVQNCNVSSVIAPSNVKQQLESLQRCQSLEEVQRLYEHGDYAAVVDLLVLTFNQPRASRKQSLDGVPERHAQLLLLQNSLMKLERYRDCVYWSEVSFNEALQQFMNATKNCEWSETMAQLLSGLDKCARLDPKNLGNLEESKLVRLTQNLVLVIVIQMENYDFAGDNAALMVVLPWIILYRLILNEERRNKQKSSNNFTESEDIEIDVETKAIGSNFLSDFDLSASIPSSLMLLFTAHECLGRRSWCTACDGLLLLTIIDIMMAELQDATGKAYLYREDLETGLEQCIYCLYGHPNKRSRAKHLQEHNARQITLTWERAVLVSKYFKPNILPEFDSYRTSTISAELENLFRRISLLVPPVEDPTSLVDGYTAYIEGGTDKCPDPPFGSKKLSIVVKDLYYLLGDYYFKNKEFSKAIRFYLCDICINPDRQDSWAGMALSRSSQLDQKLNSYELRNESTIYRKASSALRCFEHSLELDPTTTSLWIEYGSLAYILHSHASRQLKQETFPDDLHDMLKKKKKEMLQVAKRCFRNANHSEDGGEPEEAWLHHYMLGKIAEKEGEGPVVYLDHYKKALAYLHEDFARYPQKILYHNPADLSIEALEVYYRVHVSCIKFLQKYESSGLDLATVKVIQECLHSVKKSPFYTFQEKSKSEIVGSSSNAASETEDVIPVTISEPQPKVDHNYFENTSINAKKISEDTRHSRPSTDSLPESPDLIDIKEILDSLVSVVAERFVDEAKEEADLEKLVCGILEEVNDEECKQDPRKLIVESLVEESVYTTKNSSEQSSPAEVDPVDKIILPLQEPMICSELDGLAKIQELAEEIVAKAAACENQKMELDVEENSVKLPVVENSATAVIEDAEVTEALSFILDSLENATTTIAEEKSDEMEACSTTIAEEKDLKVKNIVDETVQEANSNVSSTVLNDPVVESAPDGDAEESKCIQSMEVSTSDTVNVKSSDEPQVIVPDVPESMEVDTENQETDGTASEKKIDSHDTADEKKGSNEKDMPESSVSKDNSSAPQNDKNCADAANAVTKSSSEIPPASAEDLKKSKSEIARLVPKCLDAFRECLQRFPQHYKALYRMAHYYCHSTSASRNLQWAREILLAATPATKKYPSMSGLFAERKNTNFFNGIWRAPSNEIDRPGTFGAHMYRSVHLLINVLTQQKDYNMLVNLTLQMHRTPDLGKKYMRDTDRLFLVRKAYDACVNILRDQMNTLLQEEPPPEESRLICCLLEIYRTWMTLIKSSINIEDSNELLEEAYTMYKLGEVDSHPSVLDQAKNFCQIQLGKTYPSIDPVKSTASSKYSAIPDISIINPSSISSVTTYNPDAWQKELAESLMMPVLPCEGKPEAKPAKVETKSSQSPQDPLSRKTVDSSFNSSQLPTPSVAQNLPTSSQMIHVEKPKVENLQACSVAYLPVAPVFPKEPIKPPPVFQAPPLLSCQAFECFDVLTSIMQASGYQVAPPMAGVPPAFDPSTSYNFKGKIKNMQRYPNYPPKMTGMRVGRKRRRGRYPKMEGLNLSKKMHTKPIVSATIANSITQLKIDPVVTSDRKTQPEPAQSSPLCLVKPKSNKRVPCYKTNNSPTNSKGLDLTKKSLDAVTSTQCSVIVSTSDSSKLTPDQDKEKDKDKGKATKNAKKDKKIVANMLPDIYDFTDDSNLSTNLETSRIEKCAKEMLEFMNQKVEDTGLNDQGTSDISIPKSQMDNILRLLDAENDSEKDNKPTFSNEGDIKLENVLEKQRENNVDAEAQEAGHVEKTVKSPKSAEDKNEPPELIIAENINQLSKDSTNSTTEFTLFTTKPEDAVEKSEKDEKMVTEDTPETKPETFENFKNIGGVEEESECIFGISIRTESNVGAELNIFDGGMRNILHDSVVAENNADLKNAKSNTPRAEEEKKRNDDEAIKKDYDEEDMETDEDESSSELILVKLDDNGSMETLTDEDSSLKDEVNKQHPVGNTENEVKRDESDQTEGAEMKNEEKEQDGGNTPKQNSDTESTVEAKEGESGSPKTNTNNTILESSDLAKDVTKLKREKGDAEEMSMPKLEAVSFDSRGECSKSNGDHSNVMQLGNNETKNINYNSILKKDCVVVIKLKSDDDDEKDYSCGEKNDNVTDDKK